MMELDYPNTRWLCLQQDAWQKAIERRIAAEECGIHPFRFDGLRGEVQISRDRLQAGLEKVRVEITNRTLRDPKQDVLLQCLVSTHTILTALDGEFVSL